jgi:Zn-dependent peptidase ImmA (M78 family)
MIYGSRVRQARELRGLKQGELATALGISPGRLTQIETSDGSMSMSETAVATLSAQLRFPPDFFTVPIPEELGDGSMRFRARKAMTKKELAGIRRQAELSHELAHYLLTHVDVPTPRVPALPATTDIEEAAQHTRAALSVAPDAVIPRLWTVLERAGILVYAIDTPDDSRVDAFSTWTGPNLERPIIAIGTNRSWDRARLTAAHELGHLVLHRNAVDDPVLGIDVERDANRFAGAFLFPRDAAVEELPRPVTLSRLAPLKLRWGMSLGALIERAKEVGVIDTARASSLHRQIAARGWRTREPGADAREPEQPRALRKMTELVYGTPPDPRKIAEHFHRYTTDVVRDLERYAPPPGRKPPIRFRPDARQTSRSAKEELSVVVPFRPRPGAR